MSGTSKNLLCGYSYDPLNRLAASTSPTQASTQRFYRKERLATEVQGPVQRSVMQHDDHLLAQHRHQAGTVDAQLLATDPQRCVLTLLEATPHLLCYNAYGHSAPGNGVLSLLAFNGERREPVTGCYLLGNGYRAFNPVLMRFISPDSWSPFGRGGINPYAYCAGDPVNNRDDTGHVFGKLLQALKPKGDAYKRLKDNELLKAHYEYLEFQNAQKKKVRQMKDPFLRNQAKLDRQIELKSYYEDKNTNIIEAFMQVEIGDTMGMDKRDFLDSSLKTKIVRYEKRIIHYENKIKDLENKAAAKLSQAATNIRE